MLCREVWDTGLGGITHLRLGGEEKSPNFAAGAWAALVKGLCC